MDWSSILAAVNVVLGITLAGYSLYYARQSQPEPWKWIKYSYAVVGLYWAGLYIYVLAVNWLGLAPAEPVWFGRAFVRPAFTITLAIITAGAIARVRKL